jgi:hypothetical protein
MSGFARVVLVLGLGVAALVGCSSKPEPVVKTTPSRLLYMREKGQAAQKQREGVRQSGAPASRP